MCLTWLIAQIRMVTSGSILIVNAPFFMFCINALTTSTQLRTLNFRQATPLVQEMSLRNMNKQLQWWPSWIHVSIWTDLSKTEPSCCSNGFKVNLDLRYLSLVIYIYSRTSMARTHRDHWCEFDPSMCSSDT